MIAEVLSDAKDRMSKAVEVAKEDFATIRTGRANPALFQKILVDYYGTPTPLAQLASLQNPEARTILITPYDKGALKETIAVMEADPQMLPRWSFTCVRAGSVMNLEAIGTMP